MAVFDKELSGAYMAAAHFADATRHAFVAPIHMLRGLLDNSPYLRRVIRGAGIDLHGLKKDVAAVIDSHLNGKMPLFDSELSRSKPSEALNVLIARAESYRMRNATARTEVCCLDMMLALLGEPKETAVGKILCDYHLDRRTFVRTVSVGAAKKAAEVPDAMDAFIDESLHDLRPEPVSQAPGLINSFTSDLTASAIAGKLGPVHGRDDVIARAIMALCRRNKNAPLLVGAPGVGKTAIVEGIAQKIVAGSVPEVLKGCRVVSLNLGTLVAGTKFRGDLEQRIRSLIDEMQRDEKLIVFIDEMHLLCGAGASGGGMDIANLLKPIMARPGFRFIGATTWDDKRKYMLQDAALMRRLQEISVDEPGEEQAVVILMGVKGDYESHHGVKYSADAVRAAVRQSIIRMKDRMLPDKAIDVLDYAGTKRAAQGGHQPDMEISAQEIVEAVTEMTGMPAAADLPTVANVAAAMRARVFGQDQAINELADCVKLKRAGLTASDRPAGTYLFTGPTGVGKTEVARSLADALGAKLIRFDMSEYMERHSASRLIGAPPGYIGYEKGGLLTEAVSNHPDCVLLLDEYEKAHPDLHSILLQVMDQGILTDSSGKSVSFMNVTIILTSNIGAEESSKPAVGFLREDRDGEDIEAITTFFRPEFRNRLDGTIRFHHLSRAVMPQVVKKNLAGIAALLAEKGVSIEADESAVAWLADKGYCKEFGARPMKRLIQREVSLKLADEILSGCLSAGGAVHLSAESSGIKFNIEGRKSAA